MFSITVRKKEKKGKKIDYKEKKRRRKRGEKTRNDSVVK